MKSWFDAFAIAREVAAPLPGQTIPVAEAGGQVLASPIICVRPVPAFDNAAMDGFATCGPGPWTVTGLLLAGGFTALPSLSPGEAIEIATGAPVPVGTTAVLPYEDATVAGRRVSGVLGERTHVRRAGETLAAGALVSPAGRIVTATLAGATVQAGVDVVTTVRPPTVTLLVTGDEVISDGVPGPGQVRDTFTGLVTALTLRAGGVLRERRHQKDDPVSLAAALDDTDAEVVVVSGSSSAGAADHLHTVLTDRGATWHVRGVACRPGHPQALAELPGGRWVVSLPGNPFAGLIAGLTLLEPLLETMAGRPCHPLPTAAVTGSTTLMRGGVRIVPVVHSPQGTRIAADRGSAGLHAVALADALAVLPDDWTPGTPARLLAIP
ncbi:molybdopterin-binding protein [Actinoplanes sp. OR16]|uniref:molybdopterin-binding protein n=1 Tax=Actinoplanes sp. OR16 TaxID=946334 RepID=UPI000FDA85E7|nr:molybdopterin-binding protein [Actinoplanes sp. OR16]